MGRVLSDFWISLCISQNAQAYEWLEIPNSMGYKKDVLTGADGIDIRREVSSSDKSVIIGGTGYYTDNAAEYTSFIGCEVFGIYEDTTNKLVYVFKPRNGGEKITKIDISDFISYTKDEIKYYVKDRTVSANITDAVLLFNGAPIKRNIENVMNGLIDGMVKLIDSDGSENTVNVYENDLYKTGNVKLSEIKEGDLIRYRTNYKGRVHDIELLYRPSEFDFKNWKNYNEQTSLFDATYDQYFQLSFGYVSEVSEHNVGCGYKSGTQTDEMIDLSSINCMFYDSGAKDDQKIYTNRSSSVRDFKSFGDKCDKIIVQLKNGNVYAAVVYR